MEKTPKWFSIGQAAKYLGVSRDTLRRWEKRGKFKSVRSPTNRRYYTKSQLELLMSNKTEESTPTFKRFTIGGNLLLILWGFLGFLTAVILFLLVQTLSA